MPQAVPSRKCRRLVTLCPDAMHREFFDLVERSGESAGVIIRGLIGEAIARGRRGEALVPALTAGAPAVTAGG